MMMNKRLIAMVSESKKYVAGTVALQWCSLVANIAMMVSVTRLLEGLYYHRAGHGELIHTFLIVLAVMLVRYGCSMGVSRLGFLSSRTVKKKLRTGLYEKLLKLGASYREQVKTSEIVQVAVEGIEQLETYFGAYLPQFFYAVLAPFTLFVVLCFVNVPSALVLLICEPLIPMLIALVQTWAKKLLSKYWGQYTALGDTFLENLQGLTTLKIYQADGHMHEKMNREAEEFRKITMKVLTMQLNSISIMDLVAYGGAALGIVMAVTRFWAGEVSLSGCLLIILLSAEFFIPMRQLGSFFHIAMNGMAASEKIFRVLDLQEEDQTAKETVQGELLPVRCEGLCFCYGQDREILQDITMDFPANSLAAIVGESGCGKSTLAGILMGRNKGYSGSVKIGDVELSNASENSLMKTLTYVSHQSYLFKGTVRDNLLMGNPEASEEQLWEALQRANLKQFFLQEKGLDTMLTEKASNLSGGQRQCLALARALLHDSPVYIFDEATSNIDVESERDIMEQIRELAKSKTVILISHRLSNVVEAERVYVLENGRVAESGTHENLLHAKGRYAGLWDTQQELEQLGKEE